MCDSDFSASSDDEDFDSKASLSISDAASDIEESGTKDAPSILSEGSQQKYQLTYEQFERWRERQNSTTDDISEELMMTYFENKSKFLKPNTLWTHYSMLRTAISTKKKLDIGEFKRLNAFLKTQLRGYKVVNKTKCFTKGDVAKFLTEAEDSQYLLMKVALIIGIGGACKRDDMTTLLANDVKDEGTFFRIVVPNPKTRAPQEIFITSGDIPGVNMVEIVRKYVALRPTQPCEHGRFFVVFRNGKCTRQPVGINAFTNMPKAIASFLKLPNPKEYTGRCFRKLSWEFRQWRI